MAESKSYNIHWEVFKTSVKAAKQAEDVLFDEAVKAVRYEKVKPSQVWTYAKEEFSSKGYEELTKGKARENLVVVYTHQFLLPLLREGRPPNSLMDTETKELLHSIIDGLGKHGCVSELVDIVESIRHPPHGMLIIDESLADEAETILEEVVEKGRAQPYLVESIAASPALSRSLREKALRKRIDDFIEKQGHILETYKKLVDELGREASEDYEVIRQEIIEKVLEEKSSEILSLAKDNKKKGQALLRSIVFDKQLPSAFRLETAKTYVEICDTSVSTVYELLKLASKQRFESSRPLLMSKAQDIAAKIKLKAFEKEKDFLNSLDDEELESLSDFIVKAQVDKPKKNIQRLIAAGRFIYLEEENVDTYDRIADALKRAGIRAGESLISEAGLEIEKEMLDQLEEETLPEEFEDEEKWNFDLDEKEEKIKAAEDIFNNGEDVISIKPREKLENISVEPSISQTDLNNDAANDTDVKILDVPDYFAETMKEHGKTFINETFGFGTWDKLMSRLEAKLSPDIDTWATEAVREVVKDFVDEHRGHVAALIIDYATKAKLHRVTHLKKDGREDEYYEWELPSRWTRSPVNIIDLFDVQIRDVVGRVVHAISVDPEDDGRRQRIYREEIEPNIILLVEGGADKLADYTTKALMTYLRAEKELGDSPQLSPTPNPKPPLEDYQAKQYPHEVTKIENIEDHIERDKIVDPYAETQVIKEQEEVDLNAETQILETNANVSKTKTETNIESKPPEEEKVENKEEQKSEPKSAEPPYQTYIARMIREADVEKRFELFKEWVEEIEKEYISNSKKEKLNNALSGRTNYKENIEEIGRFILKKIEKEQNENLVISEGKIGAIVRNGIYIIQSLSDESMQKTAAKIFLAYLCLAHKTYLIHENHFDEIVKMFKLEDDRDIKSIAASVYGTKSKRASANASAGIEEKGELLDGEEITKRDEHSAPRKPPIQKAKHMKE